MFNPTPIEETLKEKIEPKPTFLKITEIIVYIKCFGGKIRANRSQQFFDLACS